MGNCLVNNKVVAQEELLEQLPGKDGNAIIALEKEKKKVTFEVGEEARGVVRVRIVVTRDELEQIMLLESCKKDSDTVKDFKRALRSRARMISEVGNDGGGEITRGRVWRPALESIPEEEIYLEFS